MKLLATLSLACALLGGTASSAAGEIKVLTQNQYLGADLAPLVTAADAPA